MEFLLITVALLVATGGCGACSNACFCPPGTSMLCADRGLTQPPSGYWPSITYASLFKNNFSVLYPTTFTSFPALNTLYLQMNQLREMDVDTFAVMPNLKILDLLQNEISDVVSGSAVLSELLVLYLHYNNIRHLDPDLLAKVAPKLRYLYLDENPLEIADGSPVLNHPTLVYLYLRYLPAPLVVGSNTFAGLPKLQEISLVGSGITTIDGAFASNSRLLNLYLKDNAIAQLLANTFAPSNTIRWLDLSGNPLSRLEVSAVSSSVKAQGSVLLDDTPLACACDYVGLYWWAVGKGVALSASCESRAQDCHFARLTSLSHRQ